MAGKSYLFTSTESQKLCEEAYQRALEIVFIRNIDKTTEQMIRIKTKAIQKANIKLIKQHKKQMKHPDDIARAKRTIQQLQGKST